MGARLHVHVQQGGDGLVQQGGDGLVQQGGDGLVQQGGDGLTHWPVVAHCLQQR